MTRRFITAGAIAFLLATISTKSAQAQWGYPFGFGDWGWGGWGASTHEGDVARGLGAFAAGAGFYNLKTAAATAIDTETVMKWNEYIYQSQMEANRMRHARLAQARLNNSRLTDQIRQRLRDNPERADVDRGDALNVAFDEINDPHVYVRKLPAGKVQLGGDLIRNIPFQRASAAITVSIYHIVDGDPPAVLRKAEFEAELAVIKSLGNELRGQIKDGEDPDRATIQKMLEAIGKAEAKVTADLSPNTRDRNEADRYLKALHGLIGMLKTPAIDVILAGVEKRPDATLAELLDFMNAFSLRFGVAATPRQKQVYGALYPKLLELRKAVNTAQAKAAAPAPGVDAAEDFFAGLSYQDLDKIVPPSPVPTDSR
jgi:hypothetical protein